MEEARPSAKVGFQRDLRPRRRAYLKEPSHRVPLPKSKPGSRPRFEDDVVDVKRDTGKERG